MISFRNEPFTDFTKQHNIDSFSHALSRVRAEFGNQYDLIIGGKKVVTDRKITSINPAKKSEVLGVVSSADEALAEQAMQAASSAFLTWSKTSVQVRSGLLFRTAALLRRRKEYFSAWLVVEAGKTWAEADGDTAEAIDFLEFYAREMLRLSEEQPLTPLAGERNQLTYVPLGVGVIIPPWNFPLAIMAGMTTAAIVCGNTAVLKPASPTPIIAYKFMELLIEAGLPDGVVNYLPGPGSSVGEYLVKHNDTRFISFTGSRDVGLGINELAARRQPGQRWIKRLVAEMGGKDAIIVDENADLDLAADAIVKAAFGFSGQKCSACSRAILHQNIYAETLEKIATLTEKLKVGDPRVANMDLGPVIDNSAYEKILSYIKMGNTEGKLVAGGSALFEEEGYFIQPTVFADVSPEANISLQEIFGPVLAVTRANNFDHALSIANNTEYGLTGAAFSRDVYNLEKASREFHVGNLYLNRKCTGALVGVHPFGGFNMSGTDSKAGSRDYLLLFLQAKLVSESF